METSAKTNINIELAFCELAESILDKTAGEQPVIGPGLVNPSADSGGTQRNCCSS